MSKLSAALKKVKKATGRSVTKLLVDPLDTQGFASGKRKLTLKSIADPMRVGIDAPSKTLNVAGAIAATIATAGAASAALGGSTIVGAVPEVVGGGTTGGGLIGAAATVGTDLAKSTAKAAVAKAVAGSGSAHSPRATTIPVTAFRPTSSATAPTANRGFFVLIGEFIHRALTGKT